MRIDNLEAKRAKKAYEFAEVGNKKQKESNNKFNYSAAIQELPAMLRMNGLRATMAYYYSKKEQYKCIFGQLRDWFKDENEPTKIMSAKLNAPTSETAEEKVFMNVLLNLSNDEYRIVQAETLTLANWMIRFVKTEESKSPSKKIPDDAVQPET